MQTPKEAREQVSYSIRSALLLAATGMVLALASCSDTVGITITPGGGAGDDGQSPLLVLLLFLVVGAIVAGIAVVVRRRRRSGPGDNS